MTEREWLGCSDSFAKLLFLNGKTSPRKLRLFAIGCLQAYFSNLSSPSDSEVFAIAERFADNEATSDEIAVALAGLDSSVEPYSLVLGVSVDAARAALHVSMSIDDNLSATDYWEDDRQLKILEDVFGLLPFRIPTISQSWLHWNAGAIGKLIRAIYAEHRFSELPLLADALEEAGCDNAEILAHCRGPGPHVRGCWVLDLLLGKE